MGRNVDLNCDLGEGYGTYRSGDDAALIALVSSANIACGYHAGDAHTMRAAVFACVEKGVAIGAHPGLPDPLGFGRREMQATAREVEDYMLHQVGALQAFARIAGGRVAHVKPHGALYHMAARRDDLAEAVVRAAKALDPRLAVVGPGGSALLRSAEAYGLRAIVEGFADRAYLADGSLAPRAMPGAVLDDPARALRQALDLLEQGRVKTADGQTALVRAETICIHGDTPGAAAFAAALRRGLEVNGYVVRAP
ncbi:5-oxoprolinase subunit PxpA [Cohnella sp. REN36]|uniref:5-oxoprolinase subunit PxpA n=1 Tax=Cohnella sp. REN36 TaxID=2887347 RepID=UPI001D1450B9|nr:5-oxoprolinase subunit PxpA [Cohnella sp. REN36]MCC3374901.1 LamB/YcsF family protein [Cohnella sp. REN36]